MKNIGLRGSVIRNPEQRAAQRQQILEAASRVFARKGYGAAKMDDIASEMGMTKAVLYYQFASKQDIIVETRRIASGGSFDRLVEIAGRDAPLLERIEAAIRELAETNFDSISRHVIQTPLTVGLSPEHVAAVREVETRYEALFSDLLAQAQAEGSVIQAPVKVLAYTLIRSSLTPSSWYKEEGPVDKDTVIHLITTMLMRSISTRPWPDPSAIADPV